MDGGPAVDIRARESRPEGEGKPVPAASPAWKEAELEGREAFGPGPHPGPRGHPGAAGGGREKGACGRLGGGHDHRQGQRRRTGVAGGPGIEIRSSPEGWPEDGGRGVGGDAGAAPAVRYTRPHDNGGQRQGIRRTQGSGGGARRRVPVRDTPALLGTGPERAHERAGAAVPAEGDGPAGDHRRAGEGGAGPAELASAPIARLPDPRRGAARGPASLTRAVPRRTGGGGRGRTGIPWRVRPGSGRATPSLRPDGRAPPRRGRCAARKTRLRSVSKGPGPSRALNAGARKPGNPASRPFPPLGCTPAAEMAGVALRSGGGDQAGYILEQMRRDRSVAERCADAATCMLESCVLPADGQYAQTRTDHESSNRAGLMAGTNTKLSAAVEAYFTDLGRVRASGGATVERSSYGPLANLLNAIGAQLRPKVFCVGELADQGAGHPDFGLYAAKQVQRGRPREGQIPEHGVVEVKATSDDAWLTAVSDQVSRYRDRYRLVLITNTRDFVLVGEDTTGRPAKLESFRLADSASDFERKLDEPPKFAQASGAGLGEYLCRALSYRASLTEPKDLAWLLASYARDGLARVEAAGETPQLRAVRSALEEALGVRFEGEKGARFFHSTLVQTLFYGVFAAWVLWSRTTKRNDGPLFRDAYGNTSFDWRTAVWHLRAPVLAALFQQISQPGRLQPLGLIEVLDWTAAALDRVDREAFFSRFNEGEAVPYFYEPFLEAFDPELRKELGVWYTPTEVVRYMVERVDKALKDDLDIPEGLAAENVYVLDPCCGTGAYLAEVLRKIAGNLEGQGLGALSGARLKQAVTERVFGFEIMPAPFVVAHLQVGLALRDLDAPFSDDGTERAGVFLTNALTGWEPTTTKPLPFPELEEERDRAEQIKQETPILVILGNPPYNGFAGMAVDEERELSEAYRSTNQVRQPEGQGLNDLYIRFFRMAERRIAEKTGQGVVCFISNYSWLDGLSFSGMREHYLDVFDSLRIDCLNGDKYKTGKVAPDGTPDPSIFSTEGNPVGIQVGTAIATLVRKAAHKAADNVEFRHLWGQAKPTDLIATAAAEPIALYEGIKPVPELGLPFVRTAISNEWFDWPTLAELFPVSFSGIKTSRNGFLIDTDLDRLRRRIEDYFDAGMSHEEIARRYPSAMKDIGNSRARTVRDALLRRGGPYESGFVRYAYRAFDTRWLYWEADSGLLDRPRADFGLHAFEGNLWIEARGRETKEEYSRGTFVRHLADNFGNGLSSFFPAWLRDEDLGGNGTGTHRANLSEAAQCYLKRLGLGVEVLFHHVLTTLHDPAYREANAGALRMEWPRVPLPGWPIGENGEAAAALTTSAARGREIAALLDSETPVPGITQAPLRTEITVIAAPATMDGRNMSGDDFALTTNWGHHGREDAVMPGQGRAVERPYAPEERVVMNITAPALGATTFDIWLNGNAYWRNVPSAVWNYRLGGYRVLKKWLSYRQLDILGRPLRIEEVQHFAETARRIAAILSMSPPKKPHHET